MNTNNTTTHEQKPRRSFFVACMLALGAAACLLVSGCETFRAWGEKSSSTPGTFGGSMSIPLGKK